MLRRAFFASAFGALAGLAAAPKRVRVIERLEGGRWVPIWLAEARSGDRFRLLSGRAAGNEYVMGADPVFKGKNCWGNDQWTVQARLVAARGKPIVTREA